MAGHSRSQNLERVLTSVPVERGLGLTNLQLLERLLAPGIREPEGEGLLYHAARGKHAFWRTARALLDVVTGLPEPVRAFDALYAIVIQQRRTQHKEVIAAIDPTADRGMAIPEVWFHVGWDKEANLMGLPTIAPH